MKLVITMSRRFGTGASIIAEELSKRLDIPVYDKAYIEEKSSLITNMKVKLKQSGNWLKTLALFSDDAPQIF